jgi:hypothetical protein
LRFVPSSALFLFLFTFFAGCPAPPGPSPYDDDFDGFDSDEDCDDHNAFVYPGAPELCDERDNDCDDAIDEDVETFPEWMIDEDGDGYGGEPKVTGSCDEPDNAVDKGGHSLLDETVEFFGNELSDPPNHRKQNKPFMLAANGGGLRTGRWLRHQNNPSHNNLLVTLLNLFGD